MTKDNLRVALAQINPTLGDFSNNADKILNEIQRSQEKHCDLVVFPEAVLFGYHPFDLLERSEAVDAQLRELKRIHKAMHKGILAVVGCFTKNPAKAGRPFHNSAAILERGKAIRFIHKTLLPTGDVFDEARFVEPGELKKNFFTCKGHKILLTICEDIWAWDQKGKRNQYAKNPLRDLCNSGPDLVINLSASPFYLGKDKDRKLVTGETAKFFKAPIIYVNMVGAQDEIIYDGGSFSLDKNGKTVSQNMFFEEDLNVLDLKKNESGRRPALKKESEILRSALVLGLRDYCSKVGIKRAHLGLSGGIDSAVVACLAVEALGPGNVLGVGLPGPFNSAESLELAKKLAKNLNIKFKAVSIAEPYDLLEKHLGKSLELDRFSLVHENLQARLRGLILMAVSNKENSMLLTTSNKSEMASGYSTLYGDMCGGLAPIGDLTKKQVYNLASLYNSESEIIPKLIITRPPSAELRPNQKDQDTLPPYDDLDAAVVNLIELGKAPKSPTEKWLLPVIYRNEFKRWQAPPILKVSRHSFGRGRRWPIAHKCSIDFKN